jgi:lipopolysaccharide export LptBFGC system permease protein LptF
MNKTNKNKNIFDELDRGIEEFKTAIKISRQERILKTQRRILQVFLVILLILATAYICVGIHRELDITGILMGIMCLFLAGCLWIFIKKILKTNLKKGGKS